MILGVKLEDLMAIRQELLRVQGKIDRYAEQNSGRLSSENNMDLLVISQDLRFATSSLRSLWNEHPEAERALIKQLHTVK